MVYAGFWRRLASHVIDIIIFIILMAIVLSVLGIDFAQYADPNRQQDVGGSLIQQLISAIIIVALWIKFLGTPGKLIMKCNIVDARTGGAIGVGQGIIRYIGYIISLIPLCLGFFWIIWDKKKQGFHDKMAGTVVIVKQK